MKISDIGRDAFIVCATVAMLAGCSGSQLPIGASRADSVSSAKPRGAYSSLYSFQAKPDGENPEAPLISLNGVLYGTTSAGGTKCEGRGCGTVFEITTAGSETVLYHFKGRPDDGAEPLAELIAVNQELYGTTYAGGVVCIPKSTGCGTIFATDTSGNEHTLYKFTGIPDGARPQAPLTLVGNTLYGTTIAGGEKCAEDKNGCGTVFAIDGSGVETVLYRFKGSPDGAEPTGNLVPLNGILYGTTMEGGTYHGGTIFTITPSGSEQVVYSAGSIPYDMAYPSGLVAMDGVLYGTSIFGGKHSGGTVYDVTTAGSEHVLYNFSQTRLQNGDRPSGTLAALNSVLYGTTQDGGQIHGGNGIIYSISLSGKLQIIYRFKGAPDGSGPSAGVTDAGGVLYGTTVSGGTGCHYQSCQSGYGTVFDLSP